MYICERRFWYTKALLCYQNAAAMIACRQAPCTQAAFIITTSEMMLPTRRFIQAIVQPNQHIVIYTINVYRRKPELLFTILAKP